jgi:gamma-glutamylaminecyclotransferase
MKATDETPYMFVYGTLMRGYGNNRLLRNAEFVGSAKTSERYTLYSSGIPFLTEGEMVNVKGEVFKVNEEILPSVDILEGHPVWYRRKIISVNLEDGNTVKAWAYFMPKSLMSSFAKIVKDGDYKSVSEPRHYKSA